MNELTLLLNLRVVYENYIRLRSTKEIKEFVVIKK